MAYGTIKVDTITFTNDGVDKSIAISGLVQNPTFTGNVTVTGTISGNTVRGQTISGVTVTGTTANFTSGNFTNISGGTHTITSGVFASGTAANPSISFVSDPNTGIYSPGADQVAISTNGTGRLFVDASGRVIVGASSAAVGNPLEVVATSNGNAIAVRGRSSDNLGIITFHPNASSTEYARIQAESDSSLRFGTGSAGSERMRLDSSGRLGLGTSSPAQLLETQDGNIQIRNSGALSQNTLSTYGLTFRNTNQIGQDRGTIAEIKTYLAGAGDNDFGLQFRTQATTSGGVTTKMTLTPGGLLGIGVTAPQGILEIKKDGASTTPNLVLTSGGSGDPSSVDPSVQFAASTLESIGTTKILSTGAYGSRALAFHTGTDGAGTERARIDSSGRLLVGTSSTSSNTTALLQGYGGVTTGAAHLRLARGSNSPASGDNLGLVLFSDSEHTNCAFISADRDGGTWSASSKPTRLVFSTTADGASSPTERMRISSGGELLVGGTNDNGAYNIQCNGTGVWGFGAYVNGSDERLKENIHPLPASLNVIKALNPVAFQYKPEFTADTSVQPGFIAQELQVALAGQDYLEGVVQTGPQYLSVAYQSLIPILTKALQEAVAKIETLEAKVAALEGV
jgi:hypothetical protein